MREIKQRRGSDIIHVETITAYESLRRHLIIGSWVGHALFLLYGIFLGFSYGGLGGIQFFSSLYLFEQLDSWAALLGMLMGVFIGLVCVWTIFVIGAAMVGGFIYWAKHRSYPAKPK